MSLNLGSRSVSERRRRYYAHNGEETPVVWRFDAAHREPPEEPEHFTELRTDVQSLMPRQRWKLWLTVIAAVGLWLALMVLGVRADLRTPEWRNVIGLTQGPAPRWFSTVMLLASAQLSFLMLWHRSRSRKDYWGRYRIWFWTGITWLVCCCAVASDWHGALARNFMANRPLRIWNGTAMCWMIFTTPVLISLLQLLRREMAHCRISGNVLRATGFFAACSAILTYTAPLSDRSYPWLVIRVGSTTLWHLLAAATMLMHAHFVIHITNEAAPRRTRKRRPSLKARAERWKQVISARLARHRGAVVETAVTPDAPKSRGQAKAAASATTVAATEPVLKSPEQVSKRDMPSEAPDRTVASGDFKKLGAEQPQVASPAKRLFSFFSKQADTSQSSSPPNQPIEAAKPVVAKPVDTAKPTVTAKPEKAPPPVVTSGSSAAPSAAQPAADDQPKPKWWGWFGSGKSADALSESTQSADVATEKSASTTPQPAKASSTPEVPVRPVANQSAQLPKPVAKPASATPVVPAKNVASEQRPANPVAKPMPQPMATVQPPSMQSRPSPTPPAAASKPAVAKPHFNYEADDDDQDEDRAVDENDNDTGSEGLSRKERKRLKKLRQQGRA